MTGRVSTRAIIVPGLSLGEFLGSDSRLSVGGFLVWPQGTYVFEYRSEEHTSELQSPC